MISEEIVSGYGPGQTIRENNWLTNPAYLFPVEELYVQITSNLDTTQEILLVSDKPLDPSSLRDQAHWFLF
jgi:hypothetical protein